METDSLASIDLALREVALTYPEAVEEFPWGERAIKVRKKIFVTLSHHKGHLYMSVKLPESGEAALTLPYTSPTGYGLGKSGWVTATFDPGDEPPMDLLAEWIEESYRTIAPKKLVALLPELTVVAERTSE